MATVSSIFAVELGFMPAAQAISDPNHPGLLRAGSRSAAPYGDESVESHTCSAVDWTQEGTCRPDLYEFGFDKVDLSSLDALQLACTQVRQAGQVSDQEEATIRAALDGSTLTCSGGRTLTVLHVAEEGFIMRRTGPNRMSVVEPGSTTANSHGGANSIHADQDVFGTPLTQLMQGRAPSMFRHDSPDGYNRTESLMMVNLWIPLQQITQPLVLADGRSIDRRKHQLRYGLATDSFLEREDELAVNDIWTFLYDPAQQWYFRSEMDSSSAYVFNTLSTPHGAGVLPGEDVAEQYYRALQAAESAVALGEVAELVTVASQAERLSEDGQPLTQPLHQAIVAMAALLNEAHSHAEEVCGEYAEQWVSRSQAVRGLLVRMSIELRMVVSVTG